jgi:ATP-dependent DNA ligase
MKLERLYKTAKTGAIQVFDIEILKDTYTVTWGQKDGKVQSKSTTCKPKNIGKSNETTAEAQAILEAKAVWTKKQKSGYSTSVSAPTTVSLPMKVKVWAKGKLPPKVEFPLLSTPKLNGLNGMYRLENDTLKLYSRGGDEYPAIPHLEDEIRKVMKHLDSKELNGELYIPNTHLQDITAAVKKPNDLSHKLEFHIFDIADSKAVFDVRHDSLILAECQITDLTYVKFLTGVDCYTHTDIENHYNACMAAGLEGTVIKDTDSLYEHNVRSNRQWKYKKAKDGEFKVTDFALDKNGHAVFVCELPDNTFKVKLKGTHEQRTEMAANASSYIGKWLTIEYETLSKSNVPLKPVGIAFRECDTNGNPTE